MYIIILQFFYYLFLYLFLFIDRTIELTIVSRTAVLPGFRFRSPCGDIEVVKWINKSSRNRADPRRVGLPAFFVRTIES